MQIVEIDGFKARCEARGIMREVSLYLIQDDQAAIGDFVMVHVGYAIQLMSEQEAHSSWKLHDELLASGADGA